jgi:hypothetical protein
MYREFWGEWKSIGEWTLEDQEVEGREQYSGT